nr:MULTISPECIES: enolase C-terminal domain-like protein [Rhodomicrobium]
MAPRLAIRDIAIFERMMPFVRPFRFGAVTVTRAPQAFARVGVEVEGHGAARGVAAEMMMPKWFDKNPAKSPDETVGDLRASVARAAAAYAARAEADTAFGHHCETLLSQSAWAESRGLPTLTANFGPALMDKAVLDALLKALGLGLADGLCGNAPGLDARLTPDLDRTDVDDFLLDMQPSPSVAIRHTVGLLDELDGPHGLAADIRSTSLRHFKIKIGGDVSADLERLRAVTTLLAASAQDFRATLDANEQYDPDRLAVLLDSLETDPALAALRARLLYIEQPFDRRATFDAPLDERIGIPLIIDEADGDYAAFPRAALLGYRGVSSKSCKGLYKSLLNAARARAWNLSAGQPGRFFLTGEDLTCQAGLSVQQDTALAAILGITHVERNGHHYVDGFGPAPLDEAEAFAAAHPALYHRGKLDIRSGTLPAASLLTTPGFASGAEPDWAALAAIAPNIASQEFSA